VLVARLHAKCPADRFSSADEVAALLEKCLAHVQQPNAVPLPEACRRKRHPQRHAALRRAAVIAATTLLAASLLYVAWHTRPASDTAQDSSEMRRGSDSRTAVEPVQKQHSPAADWDAAARELDSLAADASTFEAQIEHFWSAPFVPTPAENARPAPFTEKVPGAAEQDLLKSETSPWNNQ